MEQPIHQYSVHIYWDEEEEIFTAEVPELVECFASGATHEEALQAVHQKIEAWIELARKAGHPVPAPEGRPGEEQKTGRGGRRQENNKKRRRQREQRRHERRSSS